MNRGPMLPPGARVLHIGPFKTGSTTLQAALHQNRDSLRAQGVDYPHDAARPMVAAMAAAGDRQLPGRSSAGPELWARLVKDVRAAGARRTMVSSEFFCEASEEDIASIVADLGAERLHVVVTLRPLVRILPSQWQQYAQNQKVTSYSDWLEAMLHRPDDRSITPSFWKRHHHDQLVRRWADVVGAGNLTVIAVDQGDPRMLLRTFEQLLGLEPETLVPRDIGANRSLTFPEVEMLREFNRRYLALGWSAADYTRLVRFGAARHLQRRRPAPDEPRLLTPAWAVEAANEVAAAMVRDIRASGVRIVGDLDAMVEAGPASAVGENVPLPGVPVDAAGRFTAGLVQRLVTIPAKPGPARRELGPFEATMRAHGQSRTLERKLRLVEEKRRLVEQKIAVAEAKARARAAVPLEDLGGRVLLRELTGRFRARRSQHD